jgi:hypothetical protein
VLTTLAVERPVVVAVDDMQWLDRASERALAFAARRPSPPLGLVLTRRGEGGEKLPLGDLLVRVAEDEPAAALPTLVHDRTFGRRRELLEHLAPQALDVTAREAPEATPRKTDRVQEPAHFPVADRVLMDSDDLGGLPAALDRNGSKR